MMTMMIMVDNWLQMMMLVAMMIGLIDWFVAVVV